MYGNLQAGRQAKRLAKERRDGGRQGFREGRRRRKKAVRGRGGAGRRKNVRRMEGRRSRP